MSDKRLLYFSANRVAVYRSARHILTLESSFANNEEGAEAFAAHLGGLPRSLFFVLVDIVEEDFHQENIPFVRGGDRAALLGRKLAQRYRDTSLSLAMSLGSERTQRRDERILFSAFTAVEEHADHTAEQCGLAEATGLDPTRIPDLIAGAFLHDVGKVGISDAILLKPGKLDEAEFAVMKTHVALGVDILRKSDWLQRARDVVEFHHEKFDGNGYLKGLKGEEIPITARIFAIVDVFDALTSKRPYKEPMPLDEAMGIVARSAGTHFDPRLVSVFEGMIPPLFREVSAAADADVERMLRNIIERYFLEAAVPGN